MSDDVKRWMGIAPEGRKRTVEVVLASDYDALRAERDEHERALSEIITDRDGIITDALKEADAARAESARLAERVGELEADRSDLIERIAREVYDVALCIRPDDEETILNAPNYMAAMVRAHKKRAALSPAPTETAGPARPRRIPAARRGA